MKKVFAILFVTAMTALCLVPSASFADSGYGYTEAYDSFIVSEEYLTKAKEYDLVELMKEKYPEMNDSRSYQPQYQASFVEWEVAGSFHSHLKEGKIVLNENTVYDPHIYVPIVDEENGLAVLYACIEIGTKSVTFLKGSGNCLTKESIDEIRGEVALGYTFLRFFAYNGAPYLLAHTATDDGVFYDCLYDNKDYTVREMSEKLEKTQEQYKAELKQGMLFVVTRLALVILLPVGGILLLLFLIWLLIHMYQKKKMKKKAQVSDVGEEEEAL